MWWNKLIELFYTFFLIGLFTIGGGYAMIPMIQNSAINNGWLTLEQMLNFFAIAESTPGPFAVNTATLIGFSHVFEMPLIGAITTTIAVVLPSFIIILIIAKHFSKFLDNKYIAWTITAIKAIVIGLIASVVYKLLFANIINIEEGRVDLYAIIIVVIIFTSSRVFKKVGPIPLIVLSGMLGYIFYGLL